MTIRKRKTIEEAFYSKTITGPIPPGLNTPCLLWRGKQAKHGYGLFSFFDETIGKYRERVAHRFHYTWKVGLIPDKLLVCHKCDVRNCVALDHLFLGTAKENAQDRERKHRSSPNADRNQCSLSELDVAEIRRLYREEGLSHRKLAKRFGVVHSTIRNILIGKTHKENKHPPIISPAVLGTALEMGLLRIESSVFWADSLREARLKTTFPTAKHFFGNFMEGTVHDYPSFVISVDLKLGDELVMRTSKPVVVEPKPID